MSDQKQLSRRQFMTTLALVAGTVAADWTGISSLAAQVPDKKSFPVVVIGAGLGGLISAAYLARSGFDVTLLEQHDIPGGYATTFDRGDFTFDVSLHATVAEHSQPQRILTELGLWEKMRLAHAPELKRIVTDRFDLTLPAKDPDGVKNEIARVFPGDKAGIFQFYEEMEQVQKEMWGKRGTGPSVMDRLERQTLAQWMDRHVSDPGTKICLAAFSGYYGLPPEKLNALFYAIATGEYLVRGGQYYKTRSQDLSNTIAEGIESSGGRIIYQTQADRIVLDEKQRVCQVTDNDGHSYPAKAVIANCSVPVLVNQMLPKKAVPDSFKKEIQKRNVSLSSFVVWLGLDTTLEDIRDYEIQLTPDTMEAGLFRNQAGSLMGNDISITIYDNLYNGYSKKGKTTLSIMGLADYAPWKKYEKAYFQGEKEAYNREKQRIADAFIRQVEKKLIPGLSGMIEEMEIGTPLTNIYYTKNPGGAIYGYDRDMPHLSSRTPVKGLYLSSAWSHGGGYTPVMMGGREAAREVISDFKKG